MARLVENEIGKMQKAVKRNIERRVKKSIECAAKEIQQTLVDKYVSIIADFYADKVFTTDDGIPTRTPRSYNRTYNLYSGLERIYEKTNDGVTVGISLSGNNIEYQYEANNEWVYQRAFELGIHGFARPHSNMHMESKENSEMGEAMAFHLGTYKHFPKLTNPPPIYYMNVEYNRLASNKNIRELLQKGLEK